MKKQKQKQKCIVCSNVDIKLDIIKVLNKRQEKKLTNKNSIIICLKRQPELEKERENKY